MSKLLGFLFILLLLAGVGGFAYLAFTDVEIPQETVTEETTLYAIQNSQDDDA